MTAMQEFWPLRCSIGGNYMYETDGSTSYEQPCGQPPTHRYRSPGMAAGHWAYRCAQHVGWLDTKICTVEVLAEVSQ